jgi:hypothetical protein
MFRRGNVAKLYLNTRDIYANTTNYSDPFWLELKYLRDINVEISHDEADATHRLSIFNYQIGGKVRVEFDTELLVYDGDTALKNGYQLMEQETLVGRGLHMALASGPITETGTKYFQGVFLLQLSYRHRHGELLVVELKGKLYPYIIEPSIVTVS